MESQKKLSELFEVPPMESAIKEKSTTTKLNQVNSVEIIIKPEDRQIIVEETVEKSEKTIEVEVPKPNRAAPTKQNPKKFFDCPSCSKTYYSNAALGQHIEAIHRGVRWRCDLCQKMFTYKNDLRVHIRATHTVEREKAACDICSAE